jgi:Ca-activated chloride channel homolog
MFELEAPWLLLLLPLPLLMRRVTASKRTEAALRVPFYQSLSQLHLTHQTTNNNQSLKLLNLWAIWLCLVFALSNPQWVGEPVSMPSSGRDLLLAVDISDSMRSPDVISHNRRVTRLQAVKDVVGDFVTRRTTDRLGLVLFGTQAFLQTPLTFDVKTVNQMLSEAESGFAGPATAIGDAIGLSIKRLRQYPDTRRVIILLTDGENTAGELSPEKAAELAQKAHTKIYTIAFGPNDREVDAHAMKRLAEQTGGQFFRARSTQELTAIHAQLDLLEPTETDPEMFRPKVMLFHWALGLALALSALLATSQMGWYQGLVRETKA